MGRSPGFAAERTRGRERAAGMKGAARPGGAGAAEAGEWESRVVAY